MIKISHLFPKKVLSLKKFTPYERPNQKTNGKFYRFSKIKKSYKTPSRYFRRRFSGNFEFIWIKQPNSISTGRFGRRMLRSVNQFFLPNGNFPTFTFDKNLPIAEFSSFLQSWVFNQRDSGIPIAKFKNKRAWIGNNFLKFIEFFFVISEQW